MVTVVLLQLFIQLKDGKVEVVMLVDVLNLTFTTVKTNSTWESLMMEMHIGLLCKMVKIEHKIWILSLLGMIGMSWKLNTNNEEPWSTHLNGLDGYLSLNVEQKEIWIARPLQLVTLEFMVNLNKDLSQENAENLY